MSLIFLLLKLRMMQFVERLDPLRIIVLIIATLGVIGNAHVFADSIDAGLLSGFEVDDILSVFIMLIYGFSVASIFIPVYRPPRHAISSLYPVPKFTRFAAQTALDFFTVVHALLILMMVLFVLFSSRFQADHGLLLTLALINGYLCKRAFHLLFGGKWRFSPVPVIVAVILLAAAAGSFLMDNRWYLEPLRLVVLYAAGFTIEGFLYVENRIISTRLSGEKLKLSPWITVLFNNKAAILPLVMAFILKLVILGAFLAKPEGIDAEEKVFLLPVLFMFSTPLLLFTYIFNNTWGHFPALWLTVETSRGGRLAPFLCFLRVLALPLSVDFLLSSTFFVLNKGFIPNPFAVYFISTVALVVIAYFGSTFFPILVKDGFTLMSSSRTHFAVAIGSVIGMATTIPLTMVDQLWLLALVSLLYAVFFGALGYFAVQEYHRQRTTLFQELFCNQ